VREWTGLTTVARTFLRTIDFLFFPTNNGHIERDKVEKKIVAYFTIVSLIFFVFSCYTIRKVSPAAIKENQRVYAVKTKAGEYIKVKKENPVVIQQDSIKLNKDIKIEQVVEIEWKNIKTQYGNNQSKIIALETKDGRYYIVREILSKDSEKIKMKVLLISEELVLPLADIQALWVKRISWLGTIAIGAIAVATIVLIINPGKKEPPPPPPPTTPTNWD
jgi:hypothetical protein